VEPIRADDDADKSVKDSNGTVLANVDAVVLIKDLKVKGSGSARWPAEGLAQSAYRVAQSNGLPIQTRTAAGILVSAIRKITGQGSCKVTSDGNQGNIGYGYFRGLGCAESSLPSPVHD
jgi:hypothetical protein